MDLEELNKILKEGEGARVEFKVAKNNFDSKERSDYCAGIANSGGGYLIFGVDDEGKVKGTSLYQGTIKKLPNEVHQKIGIWVEVFEVSHPNGRVVAMSIPPRPIGQRIKSDGHYHFPIRKGESLVEMDDEITRSILNETQPDFSAEILETLSIKDLAPQAIDGLRKLWAKTSNKPEYQSFSDQQILKAAGLLSDKGLTKAALILLGDEEAFKKYLPNAEIIFEWRQTRKTNFDFRKEWKNAFFLVFEEIWQTIDQRNSRFPFQEGFIQREIPAFSEKVIREAVLNAVCHRDYHLTGGSIFIKASPDELIITSPGGFPNGITPENAIKKQYARNRLLAETFQRVKLAERSGQGLDDIFRLCIEEGKGAPNFFGTDFTQVELHLPAVLKDPNFVKFLEKTVNAKHESLSIEEILVLEKMRSEGGVKELAFKERFLSLKLAEKVGHGRGTRYILSRDYYAQSHKPGLHTKLQGIGRDQKKLLILKHIQKEKKAYSQDLQDALEMKQVDINNLLQELKSEKKIKHIGNRRWGHWELY